MDTSQSDLGAVFVQTYEQTLHQLILMGPTLLVALALLLAGWAVASLFTRLGSTLISLCLSLIARFFPEYSRHHSLVFSPTQQKLFGKVIFWLVMFFFIAAASNVLGLQYVSRWLDQLFIYFPRLIAGVVIISAGYIFSQVAGLMVSSAIFRSQFPQAQLFARAVQALVFFAALIIGIEQLGINLQFITQFFIASTSIILLGFALAFALGSKQTVENILGMQQLRKVVKVGDYFHFGELEGRIVELGNTMLILDCDNKRAQIPGHVFNSQSSFHSTQHTETKNYP